jgi:hypothetical protein
VLWMEEWVASFVVWKAYVFTGFITCTWLTQCPMLSEGRNVCSWAIENCKAKQVESTSERDECDDWGGSIN